MRWLKFIGLVCGIVFLSAHSSAPAYANVPVGDIRTAATGCQATFAPSDQLLHPAQGVTTLAATDTPQLVTCIVPRMPLPADAISPAGVQVAGDNSFGASTSCTMFSFDSNGSLLATASFQTAAPQYNIFLGLAPSQISSLGHTTIRCLLPAHENGMLRAVTSHQQGSGVPTISTGTVACQPFGVPSTDIRHTENGTSSEGTASGRRLVTCAVPRFPLSPTATTASFFVTGENRDSQVLTSCTLTVYEYTGAFVGASSFSTSPGHYVQNVVMPAAQVPYWGYTSVTCALPEQARGSVESVIAESPASPAANINTIATECQALFWPQDALAHTDAGVTTTFTNADTQFVTCAVPRSPPLTAGVYVDGDNLNLMMTTRCTLFSYDETGALLGSSAFAEFVRSYDIFLTLPAVQLGSGAYTALHCALPSRGNAILRGVTSVQGVP